MWAPPESGEQQPPARADGQVAFHPRGGAVPAGDLLSVARFRNNFDAAAPIANFRHRPLPADRGAGETAKGDWREAGSGAARMVSQLRASEGSGAGRGRKSVTKIKVDASPISATTRHRAP